MSRVVSAYNSESATWPSFGQRIDRQEIWEAQIRAGIYVPEVDTGGGFTVLVHYVRCAIILPPAIMETALAPTFNMDLDNHFNRPVSQGWTRSKAKFNPYNRQKRLTRIRTAQVDRIRKERARKEYMQKLKLRQLDITLHVLEDFLHGFGNALSLALQQQAAAQAANAILANEGVQPLVTTVDSNDDSNGETPFFTGDDNAMPFDPMRTIDPDNIRDRVQAHISPAEKVNNESLSEQDQSAVYELDNSQTGSTSRSALKGKWMLLKQMTTRVVSTVFGRAAF